MRTRVGLATAALLVGFSGCDARKGDTAARPLLQWHFVGTAALAADTNAVRWRSVWGQPTTRQLAADVVQKLARVPDRVGGPSPVASERSTAPWVQPLLQTLGQVESRGEWRVRSTGAAEGMLAARLSAPDRGLWQTNWEAVVRGLGAQVSAVGAAGRSAQWAGTPRVARLGQAGDWTVLGWGTDGLPSFEKWVAALPRNAAAGAGGPRAWLTLAADLKQVATRLGLPPDLPWPQVDLQTTGRGVNLWTEGRLTSDRPWVRRPEAWRMPTNTIRDPLISFTAAQGVGSVWTGLPSLRALELAAPNQWYAWAMADIPFQTHAAWEMGDVTNTLRRLGPRIPALLTNTLPKVGFGQVALQTNTTRLAWLGMPVVEPFLSPAAPGDAGFVLAGLFPWKPAKTPAPASLYAQVLSPTNLVYYDWEITAKRLDDWRQIRNLYAMLSGYAPPPTNSPVLRWLLDTNATRHLGNTVTEMTWRSERELGLVRNGPVGLTGFELTLVMRWLEDPAFPWLSEPKPNAVIQRRQQGMPGALPAPGPGLPAPPPPGPARQP